MPTLRNFPDLDPGDRFDQLPVRWVVILTIAGVAGVGAGASGGWPQGIIAGTVVAGALNVMIKRS